MKSLILTKKIYEGDVSTSRYMPLCPHYFLKLDYKGNTFRVNFKKKKINKS